MNRHRHGGAVEGEDKINARKYSARFSKSASLALRFKTIYQTPFNADSFFWTEFTPREGFTGSREAYQTLSRSPRGRASFLR